MARWAYWLVGDFRFPTAVDDIGLEVVECLDFRVTSQKVQSFSTPMP